MRRLNSIKQVGEEKTVKIVVKCTKSFYRRLKIGQKILDKQRIFPIFIPYSALKK